MHQATLLWDREEGLAYSMSASFPCGSDGTESACNSGDLGFSPRAGKIPCRREWLATPLFLPGEFHRQRSLVGYSPWGWKSETRLNTPSLLLPLVHCDAYLWQVISYQPEATLLCTSWCLLLPEASTARSNREGEFNSLH